MHEDACSESEGVGFMWIFCKESRMKCALMAVAWIIALCLSNAGVAQVSQDEPQETVGQIKEIYRGGACDFDEFTEAVLQFQKRRKERLVTAEQFAKLAEKPGAIILDARSELSYELLHIKNSVNVPYTNFATESLRKRIPYSSTTILIYCRNNIDNAAFDRIEKTSLRHLAFAKAPAAGLNLPVAVTLAVYGYENVWELDEIVDPDHCPLAFEWSDKATKIANEIGVTLKSP